jgi:hypothetical protein
MPKKKAANPFAGRYRITLMEIYDPEYLDAAVEAFMHFGKKDLGEFQFGYVQGEMDCHYSERDGKPLVEYTWSGVDEMDLASGRGWAVLQGKDLEGEIYLHKLLATPLRNLQPSNPRSRYSSSKSNYQASIDPSGVAFKLQIARSTSCTSTSKPRWAGRTFTCMSSESRAAAMAILNCYRS